MKSSAPMARTFTAMHESALNSGRLTPEMLARMPYSQVAPASVDAKVVPAAPAVAAAVDAEVAPEEEEQTPEETIAGLERALSTASGLGARLILAAIDRLRNPG